MANDVTDLRAFYASPLGQVARRFVGQAIGRFWRELGGLRVLGLGYATPYLAALAPGAERRLAFMPAAQGVVNWPASGLSASALVDLTVMPLAEASVDRVLIVHAIEMAENPAELLAEAWRVLTPGGRLVVVAPNRRGLWARLDTTPFGEGRPFSRSQLRALLRETMFSPDGWIETLYVPPLRSRILLGGAVAWERVGLGLGLPVHGLHVVEATKLFHRPAIVRVRRAAPRARPSLLPVPATREALEEPRGR